MQIEGQKASWCWTDVDLEQSLNFGEEEHTFFPSDAAHETRQTIWPFGNSSLLDVQQINHAPFVKTFYFL